MKIFNIWSEGYSATGEFALAFCYGQFKGNTFAEACLKCFGQNKNFNLKKLTYWGCDLFDNEKEARKTFG